jgi:coenzyme PQQ precursor peptide PqqA
MVPQLKYFLVADHALRRSEARARCGAQRPIGPLRRTLHGISFPRRPPRKGAADDKGVSVAWTTPVLVEICIGLEINGYLPPEF